MQNTAEGLRRPQRLWLVFERDNFIISYPMFTKFNMNDIMSLGKNFMQ